MILGTTYLKANVNKGVAVGKSGGNPDDPAISQWAYGSGFSEPIPCLSNPLAITKYAAGPWCPRAVSVDGLLFACITCSYSVLPLWKS